MSQWRRFERDRQVIVNSGAAARIEQLLSPTLSSGKRMGRPRQLRVDVLLTAILRSFRDGHSVLLTDVHTLLTRLPGSYRKAIGVTTADGKTIKRDAVYYLVAHITARLDTNPRRSARPDQVRVAERERELQTISNMILGATLPETKPAPCEYAVDATAIDSWARPRGAKKPNNSRTNTTQSSNEEPREQLPDSWEDKTGPSYDRGAAYGHRTKTHHNRSEWVFGYQAIAFARIDRDGPTLVDRLVLAPASSQGVDEARTMLVDWQHERDARKAPRITKVLSDRGFSYAVADRWATPLRRIGIEQVIDVHPHDHGAYQYGNIVMIDGAPYHPAIPDDLRKINRPPTLSVGTAPADATAETKRAYQDLADQIEQFRELMVKRHSYAYRRKVAPDIDGKERYEAPCCVGKLKDPDCELSMQLTTDVPVITYKNGFTPAPHQRTITIHGDVQTKLRQHHLWGSDPWIDDYSRRTAVEGQFGNWKSKGGEGVERGWIRLVGRVKTTIMLTLAAAASNLRQLRAWATRTNNYTDPKTWHVIEHDEYEEVDADGNVAPYRPDAPVTFAPDTTP